MLFISLWKSKLLHNQYASYIYIIRNNINIVDEGYHYYSLQAPVTHSAPDRRFVLFMSIYIF